eukprot:759887-Hanusia_phi.AAC.3
MLADVQPEFQSFSSCSVYSSSSTIINTNTSFASSLSSSSSTTTTSFHHLGPGFLLPSSTCAFPQCDLDLVFLCLILIRDNDFFNCFDVLLLARVTVTRTKVSSPPCLKEAC